MEIENAKLCTFLTISSPSSVTEYVVSGFVFFVTFRNPGFSSAKEV